MGFRPSGVLALALGLSAGCTLTQSLDDLDQNVGVTDGGAGTAGGGSGGSGASGGSSGSGGGWGTGGAGASGGASGSAGSGGSAGGGGSSGSGGSAASGGTGGVSCDSNTADCNGEPADGCEVDLGSNSSHCGGCNTPCTAGPNASSSCVSGACVFSCNAPFINCNGNLGDGCEVNAQSDSSHCGGCGAACPISASCNNGTCVSTCSKPCGSNCCTGTQKCCTDVDLCVCANCYCPI